MGATKNTSPAKIVSDYLRPSFDFAQSLGMSTSVKGRIILNKKNWTILRPYLETHTKSVKGQYFDGMTDGHAAANRTIAQAIEGAGEVFDEKGHGSGCVFYPDTNTVSIGDCCDDYDFILRNDDNQEKIERIDEPKEEATPGPWIVEETPMQFVIKAPKNDSDYLQKIIAVTAGLQSNNKANASLIAAAPDLLELAHSLHQVLCDELGEETDEELEERNPRALAAFREYETVIEKIR